MATYNRFFFCVTYIFEHNKLEKLLLLSIYNY